MAGVVQWTINQLWDGLQQIYTILKDAKQKLDADKLKLQRLYTATRSMKDQAQAKKYQAKLDPLIHQNSVLRLTYLAPLTEKFNQASAIAASALRGAGYTTPTLSGLGFAVVIAPAAAVAIVVAALGTAYVVRRLTAAQIQNTANVAKMIEAGWTPEEIRDVEDKANPPGPFDVSGLVPVLGLVAVIMLGPQLLRAFGSRKATT